MKLVSFLFAELASQLGARQVVVWVKSALQSELLVFSLVVE